MDQTSVEFKNPEGVLDFGLFRVVPLDAKNLNNHPPTRNSKMSDHTQKEIEDSEDVDEMQTVPNVNNPDDDGIEEDKVEEEDSEDLENIEEATESETDDDRSSEDAVKMDITVDEDDDVDDEDNDNDEQAETRGFINNIYRDSFDVESVKLENWNVGAQAVEPCDTADVDAQSIVDVNHSCIEMDAMFCEDAKEEFTSSDEVAPRSLVLDTVVECGADEICTQSFPEKSHSTEDDRLWCLELDVSRIRTDSKTKKMEEEVEKVEDLHKSSSGGCQSSNDQQRDAVCQPMVEHAAVIRNTASESFKEPKLESCSGVILRPKNKSKRVDSIRKSLIKLGSFGKDGNGKGKNKKEKEKEKHKVDMLDSHAKQMHNDPEFRSLPGFQSSISCPGDRDYNNLHSSKVQQKRISNPLAADLLKLHEFSVQKQSTIQQMYQQAFDLGEAQRLEYLRNPTDATRLLYEAQLKVVKRLEERLKESSNSRTSLSSEPEVTSPSSSHVSSQLSSADSGMMEGDSASNDSILREKQDGLSGLPSQSSPSWLKKHSKTSSVGSGLTRVAATRKEASILRSHSDSCKRNNNRRETDNQRMTASTDELSRMLAAKQTIKKRYDESQKHSGSQSSNVGTDSDPSLDQLSPLSEQPSMLAESSSDSLISKAARGRQNNIMALDDQDLSDEDQGNDIANGPFSDFSRIKNRPAYLAVLLHYLISNSDPAPLLFYFVSETYPQGSGRDLRKWAYEIFSTFLAEKAPLKIAVDDVLVNSVSAILLNKHDKEEIMKSVFNPIRSMAPEMINELLVDFINKQILGLGCFFGVHELNDNLDHAAELNVVDKLLWKHFEHFVHDEDNERSTALASALAFFFKQHGYTNSKNNALLERYPTFNAKDKTKFPMFGKASRKGSVSQKTHQLIPQQYFTITYCQMCQGILCGIGNQGYQCQKCEQNFHKNCIESIKESCLGKKLRPTSSLGEKTKPTALSLVDKSKPSLVIDKLKPPILSEKPKPSEKPKLSVIVDTKSKPPSTGISLGIKRKPTLIGSKTAKDQQRPNEDSSLTSKLPVQIDAPNSEDHVKDPSPSAGQTNRSTDKADQLKSRDDTRPLSTHLCKSPESINASDDQQYFTYDADSTTVGDVVIPPAFILSSDSDFETEAELPSLDSFISKEHLKKLKPKEKKRQEVINELFYTERAHVRNLKVMYRLFYQPMRSEPLYLDLVSILFPNITQMIEVHGGLNKDFKQKKKESESAVVGDFASILVQNFSKETSERFKVVCARFCEKQSQALEILKTRQRKDPKLASLLQDATSNILCRRLELKDFLPTAMQRLTKYPLLIDSLLKYTQADTEEYQQLQLAYIGSKEILNYVNKAVLEYENHVKLFEMQKKLDKRPIENMTQKIVVDYKSLDLTRHKLLYDGTLTWRLSRDRLINLHVLLLDDLLVLLQKQDERLVLRCQSSLIAAGKEDTKTTHSPIIKLSNLLVKPVATDKYAFFLVSTSEVGPQIYDLVAGTKDEKNKWQKQISIAVEAFKETQKTTESTSNHSSKLTNLASEVKSIIHESETVVAHEDIVQDIMHSRQDVASRETMDAAAERDDDLHLHLTQNDDHGPSPLIHSDSSYLDRLRETDEEIHKKLLEKRDLLSHFYHLPVEDADNSSECLNKPSDFADPKELLLSMLSQSNHLVQRLNNSLRTTTGNVAPVSEHRYSNLEATEASDGNQNISDTQQLLVPEVVADVPPPLPVVPPPPPTQVSEDVEHPASDDKSIEAPPPVPPPSVRPRSRATENGCTISTSELINYSSRMSQSLIQLLEIATRREFEKKQMETELHKAQEQLSWVATQQQILNLTTDTTSTEVTTDNNYPPTNSLLTSDASRLSSASETTEDEYNETLDHFDNVNFENDVELRERNEEEEEKIIERDNYEDQIDAVGEIL